MYLGLDLGTTNVKATSDRRFDANRCGRDCRRLSVLPPPTESLEQDIDQIEQAAIQAITEAVATIDPTSVLAIGISSQGGALQLLDTDGKPLERVISWMDQRGHQNDVELVEGQGVDWMVEHTGCNLSSMTLGQLIRLREGRARAFRACGRNRLGR